MVKEERIKIELFGRQYDAYHFQKQFGAAICGKRSGKTYVGALWCLKKMTENPKSTGLIAAPTHKHLEQAALLKLWDLAPQLKVYYKEQKGIIDLPEGGRIFVRSTDDPLALEGMTLDWAWLDEAGMMKRDVWRIARARVVTTKGQVFITTTPYNLGWLYQEFYLPWKEGISDYEIFSWPTIDNPTIDAKEIEKERTRLRPEEFARDWEGTFTSMTGLIWHLPTTSVFGDHDAIKRILRHPDRVIAGIDWGFHNPSALLVAVIKDGAYYLVEEWKQVGKTTGEIIEVAKILSKKWEVTLWFPDPAEPDRIEEMKRSGLRVAETNKDVSLGLSHVESLIRENKLFIHERCVQLLDEIAEYRFAEGRDGQPLKEMPIKENDHLCDALRYLTMGYRPADPTMSRLREMSIKRTIPKSNTFV